MMKNTLKSLVMVTLLGHAIMAQDITEQYNLSFESDDVGCEDVPHQWTYPRSQTVSYKIIEDRPEAAAGKKCLMVDYSNAIESDKSRAFMSDFIEIEPAKSYICSFWLKTEGLTVHGYGPSVGRLYFDEDKKAIAPEVYNNRYQVMNNGTTEWTQFSQELVPQTGGNPNDFEQSQIPSTAKYVRLFFLSFNYDKKYWIDDFRFEPARSSFGASVQGDTKIARAIFTKERISVDGNLAENIWNNANDWNSGFVRTVTTESNAKTVKNQTRFKVAHDEGNIFVAVQCHSPDVKNIKTQIREANSMDVFNDEEIEIFLDCGGHRQAPFQIAINASGSCTEMFLGTNRSLGLEVASTRTSSGWTAEVRIPKDKIWQFFTEANFSVDKNLWNINVCRQQPGEPPDERYSAWNFSGSGFGNAKALGILLFEKNETVLSNRLDEVSIQMKKQLVENAPLLNKSRLGPIAKEQENIFSIKSFINDFQQTLSSGSVFPDYQFSRYLSEIDAIPERLSRSFLELQALTLAFPKEREKYGYMIYDVPLVSPADSKMMPSKGECKQLIMRVAGDEISAKRFSVFTKKELKDIRFKCSALKSSKGAQIPESQIDLRAINQWGSRHQADILVTDERVKLEGWLEKYAEQQRFVANIPAASSKHFLIQVAASADFPAGIYEGVIHMEPAGSLPTDLPIKVEILPLKLDRTERFVGFYYTGVIFQPEGPAIGRVLNSFCNGLASESSLKAEFEALSSAGFNFLSIGGYAGGPLNIDYVSKVLKIAAKAGIKKIAVQGAEWIITPAKAVTGWNKDDGAYKTLAERISKIAEVAKQNGIELYISGLDEPGDANGILRNNIIFEIAKRCGVSTTTAVIRDDIREQINGLDVTAMNFHRMSSSNSQLLQAVSRKEKIPYKNVSYYANLPATDNPVTRMAFGWYLFKSHMGGNIPWAYYTLWQNWEPFGDDATTISQDGHVYPTKDRPISTLKFEAAREGVNDLRYLEMLEKHLASGQNKKRISEYKSELDKMLSTFSIWNNKGSRSENYLVSPQTYDDYRNKVQDMLVELVKEEPERNK